MRGYQLLCKNCIYTQDTLSQPGGEETFNISGSIGGGAVGGVSLWGGGGLLHGGPGTCCILPIPVVSPKGSIPPAAPCGGTHTMHLPTPPTTTTTSTGCKRQQCRSDHHQGLASVQAGSHILGTSGWNLQHFLQGRTTIAWHSNLSCNEIFGHEIYCE